MTEKTKGNWPYHEDSHGDWKPCHSNPCKLHSGGDIMATSPEDAFAKAHAGDGGAAGMSSASGSARKPTPQHNLIKSIGVLDATHDIRKSFYGKAHVLHMDDGAIALKSYDTVVAVIRNGKIKVRGKYSQTTSRHVREFARQELEDKGIEYNENDLYKYNDDDPVFQDRLKEEEKPKKTAKSGTRKTARRNTSKPPVATGEPITIHDHSTGKTYHVNGTIDLENKLEKLFGKNIELSEDEDGNKYTTDDAISSVVKSVWTGDAQGGDDVLNISLDYDE